VHVIVVLGCRVWPSGNLSHALARRLRRAFEAASADPDAHLIVTGGDRVGPAEAPVMRDWLVEHGVDGSRITTEARARVTAENALFVAPVLGTLGATRVTVVTDRFHMRRSLVLLRAACRRHGVAVPIEPMAAEDEKRGAERVWLAFGEWHKTLWSLARLYLTR
jgi:uncharacterized SAM-binding protein YcdF (DUF218 family)